MIIAAHRNSHSDILPLIDGPQRDFLNDVFVVARRILMTDVSLDTLAAMFSCPWTGDESIGIDTAELRHLTANYISTCRPVLIACDVCKDWGFTEGKPPHRIFLRKSIIDAGGRAYSLRDSLHYSKHVFFAAQVLSHEMVHLTRMALSLITAGRIEYDTPPRLKVKGGGPGRATPLGTSGEAGWVMEDRVYGGKIVACDLDEGNPALGRLWISGLTVPHVGWTFALQDEVVQKVVHCDPGWEREFPLRGRFQNVARRLDRVRLGGLESPLGASVSSAESGGGHAGEGWRVGNCGGKISVEEASATPIRR